MFIAHGTKYFLGVPQGSILPGSTIVVRRVPMYPYFYWRKQDFGYVYVDTYAYFFPIIFKAFKIFLNLVIV